MDYLTRVWNYLDELPGGKTINVSNLNEPERFWCAVNYLVELGLITNIGWGRDGNWSKLRKYGEGRG